MNITKDLLVELIYKSLPYSEQISKLNLTYYSEAITFEWRGTCYKIDTSFMCHELEGTLIKGSDRCLLIERLIKRFYLN